MLVKIFASLLKHERIDPNPEVVRGYSALGFVISLIGTKHTSQDKVKYLFEIFKILLDHPEIDPNISYKLVTKPPLHDIVGLIGFAGTPGDRIDFLEKIFETLLRLDKTSLNAQDKDSEIPLINYIIYNLARNTISFARVNILKKIMNNVIEHGGDPYQESKEGVNSFELANKINDKTLRDSIKVILNKSKKGQAKAEDKVEKEHPVFQKKRFISILSSFQRALLRLVRKLLPV